VARVHAPARTREAAALVAALRPAEWVKNVLVLAALLFGGEFDASTLSRALLAFAAFCAASSAGYLVNDIRDAEFDRHHPVKRDRPIARGDLREPVAGAFAALLFALALALGLAVSPALAGIVAAYGATTIAYSVALKQLVIVDVMTIAACFLLRVWAGAVAVGVPASRWLIVCTGMVALFLGFTKRRQEAMSELHEGVDARPVLEHYSLPFLDQMVSMVTAGTVISYTIYATESPLVGDRMLATVPMVVYGVFRYLYLVYHCGDERSTATIVTRDGGIVGAALAVALTPARRI
jgi:4-hydroxybenzoate polyprenyltransferase